MKNLENKIEDDAKKYSKTAMFHPFHETVRKRSFIAGVKSSSAKEYWQQGMYTEEEVKDLTDDAYNVGIGVGADSKGMSFRQWFNKNKKK